MLTLACSAVDLVAGVAGTGTHAIVSWVCTARAVRLLCFGFWMTIFPAFNEVLEAKPVAVSPVSVLFFPFFNGFIFGFLPFCKRCIHAFLLVVCEASCPIHSPSVLRESETGQNNFYSKFAKASSATCIIDETVLLVTSALTSVCTGS